MTRHLRTLIPAHVYRTLLSTAAMLLLGLPVLFIPNLEAQTGDAAPKPVRYVGCVQRLPESDTLVLSTPLACARLTGRVSVNTLAGHEIEVEGVLTERTPGVPASIAVRSVTRIGRICSETCALQPPGTRGLGKGKQTPGKEGGTPGVVPPPPSAR